MENQIGSQLFLKLNWLQTSASTGTALAEKRFKSFFNGVMKMNCCFISLITKHSFDPPLCHVLQQDVHPI